MGVLGFIFLVNFFRSYNLSFCKAWLMNKTVLIGVNLFFRVKKKLWKKISMRTVAKCLKKAFFLLVGFCLKYFFEFSYLKTSFCLMIFFFFYKILF